MTLSMLYELRREGPRAHHLPRRDSNSSAFPPLPPQDGTTAPPGPHTPSAYLTPRKLSPLPGGGMLSGSLVRPKLSGDNFPGVSMTCFPRTIRAQLHRNPNQSIPM